jgi:hypothetical protein
MFCSLWRATRVAIVLAAGLTATSAFAAVISVDFNGSDTSAMAPDEAAGVVSATHWNPAGGNAGTVVGLVDNTGTTTTAAITYAGSGAYHTPTSDTPGDLRMMRGYLDGGYGAQPDILVSATNLPFVGTYSAYIYFDGDNGGDARNTDLFYPTTAANLINFGTDDSNATFDGTYVQVPDTTDANGKRPGNYFLLTGLTGDFSARLVAGYHYSGDFSRTALNGIQFVGTTVVPEPASLGLLTPAALVFTRRRRA